MVPETWIDVTWLAIGEERATSGLTGPAVLIPRWRAFVAVKNTKCRHPVGRKGSGKDYMVQMGSGGHTSGTEPDPEVSGTTASRARNARNVVPNRGG